MERIVRKEARQATVDEGSRSIPEGSFGQEEMKMKNVKKALGIAALLGLAAAYLTADESTKRYLSHVGKQVPFLPYRYFI